MTSANRAIASMYQTSSLLFKEVKIETPNSTHLTTANELKLWEDYIRISAKQKILKLWQKYKLRIRLRNLAKTAKFREELFDLLVVGKHYLDTKSRFETDVRKTSNPK